MRFLFRVLRPALLMAAPVFLLGCAPSGAALRRELSAGQRSGRYLELPFVKQRPERCGSAALAEVLGYWGAKGSSEEQLAAEVYSAKLHGSLNLDLAAAAERRGLVVRAGKSSVRELRRAVESGCPAVVLITLSPHLLGRKHYLTVKGLDAADGYLLVDDGSSPDNVLRPGPFAGDWKSAGNWALYCWPPDRPPEWASAAEHLISGLLLEERGELAAAEQACARALAQDGRLWEAAFNLGNVLLAGKRLPEAEAAYRQALCIRPAEPDVLNNLAWTLLQSGRNLDEAEGLARQALAKLVPPAPAIQTARVRHTLGRVLVALGRIEEARVVLERARAAALAAGDAAFAREIAADLQNLKPLER